MSLLDQSVIDDVGRCGVFHHEIGVAVALGRFEHILERVIGVSGVRLRLEHYVVESELAELGWVVEDCSFRFALVFAFFADGEGGGCRFDLSTAAEARVFVFFADGEGGGCRFDLSFAEFTAAEAWVFAFFADGEGGGFWCGWLFGGVFAAFSSSAGGWLFGGVFAAFSSSAGGWLFGGVFAAFSSSAGGWLFGGVFAAFSSSAGGWLFGGVFAAFSSSAGGWLFGGVFAAFSSSAGGWFGGGHDGLWVTELLRFGSRVTSARRAM